MACSRIPGTSLVGSAAVLSIVIASQGDGIDCSVVLRTEGNLKMLVATGCWQSDI